jgi:NitT/TauT family transport system substrate-binding protein
MGKATEWYASNREEGDAIMAKFWKLSPEEQKETVAGMGFMSLKENAEFFGTSANPGQMYRTVKMASDLWRKTEVIKNDVNPASLIAFDVMNEAATSK